MVLETIPADKKCKFIHKATQFLICDRKLWQRGKPDQPLQWVIFNNQQKEDIICQLYDESGHKGREGTYKKVALRYWWEGLYKDVKNYVQTCEPCQK